MRKLLRILLRCVGVVVALCLVLAGVIAYNSNHYKVPGENPRDSSVVAQQGDVESVTGNYLRGFYYPAHGTAQPGTVVVFGGSEGSNNNDVARTLQGQGYNVLGLYFFGQPGQQAELVKVPLEFFQEALDWLKQHQHQGPLTVLGVSKGAELVANLAVRYPEIDNIVVFTPSSYTYQGLGDYRNGASSSFTWKGEPVPYVPLRMPLRTTIRSILALPVSYRETYELSLAEAPDREAARIKIEEFAGRGLLFAGDQDAMWQGEAAVRELSERNKNLEAVVYPNAGHVFTEDATKLGNSWKTMLGGTVEGNREATLQSRTLLKERLAAWHAK